MPRSLLRSSLDDDLRAAFRIDFKVTPVLFEAVQTSLLIRHSDSALLPHALTVL